MNDRLLSASFVLPNSYLATCDSPYTLTVTNSAADQSFSDYIAPVETGSGLKN